MSRVIDITSSRNPRYREWVRTVRGQVRKTGRTLVSGRRIVRDVILEVAPERSSWIVPEGFPDELPGNPDIPRFHLPRALFTPLDQFGTGYPMLEIAIEGCIASLPAAAPPGLSVGIPLQDPVNVGAVLRTAAGIGAAAVFLLPGCAHPFHLRAVRASSGAVFRLPLYEAPSMDALAEIGFSLVGLDRRGVPVATFGFPPVAILVVGQEGRGLGATLGAPSALPTNAQGSSGDPHENDVSIDLISLPITGIDSYNASVAAAMALYEWKRRQPGE